MSYDERYFKNRESYEARPHKRNVIYDAIKGWNPKSVLDVGCGHGYLVKHLNSIGIKATGLDFSTHAGKQIPNDFVVSDATKLPFPDKSFDVVVSADFFEHIPEEKIDQVYTEMKRVGNHVVAWICHKPDKLLEGETEDTHVSVHSKDWWKERLSGAKII